MQAQLPKIKVGDKLPSLTLQEYIEKEQGTCTLGPNTFKIDELVQGKNIALLALPGAFTPTCSAQHVPGYIALYDELKQAGIDEIWCISVNDAFVMGAWSKQLQAQGKVRLFADGSAEFTKAMGLAIDLTPKGMGVRSQRYSALVINGKVMTLNVEQQGKFEVSKAEVMLQQAQQFIQTSKQEQQE